MLVLSNGVDEASSQGCPTTAVRALVIDRQPLFQAALGNLLSQAPIEAEVTLLSGTDGAVELVIDRAIGLVVCEARARPMSGPDLAGQLTAGGSNAKVLLLAEQEEGALLLGSLRSGAVGFFFKDSPLEEFLEGVRSVLAGHTVLCRSLTQHVLAQLEERSGAPAGDPVSHLSPAELAILVMLGQAHSIRSIAAAKGVSQKTVRNHLANIYRKLAVGGRTDAILFAARAGLVDIRD